MVSSPRVHSISSLCRIFLREETLRIRVAKFSTLRKTDAFVVRDTNRKRAHVYTQNVSPTEVLFAEISSATAAAAYYSYLKLKRYARASYICNIVNETTSHRASFDEMRRDEVAISAKDDSPVH